MPLLKTMDSINVKTDFDGRIMDSTARKVIDGYIPPIAPTGLVGRDQLTAITMYEEMANIGASQLQPRARFLYELNCAGANVARIEHLPKCRRQDRFG
jgi:hypothetical protein